MSEVTYISYKMIRPSFLMFLNRIQFSGLPDYAAVEVGSAKGENAYQMLKACPTLRLWMVDLVDYPERQELLKPFEDRITFVNKESSVAAKDFPDKSLHYIYIDAGHEYDEVTADLQAWYPKLQPGSFIGGHDFWYKPVQEAVKDFFKDKAVMCVNPFGGMTESTNIMDNETMDWWISPYL